MRERESRSEPGGGGERFVGIVVHRTKEKKQQQMVMQRYVSFWNN